MIDLDTPATLPPVWFVPSFWGDIRLTPHGDDGKRTEVVCAKLTDLERKALEALSAHAHKRGWFADGVDPSVVIGEGATLITAPIKRVAGVIAKVLKPKRKLVSAISFTDGTVEEVRTLETDRPPAALPEAEVLPAWPRRPRAAATVSAPTLGCPAPDFEAAEIRARQALVAFLTPDQIADFRQFNRFVSVGHSGRRYMVTSRHARGELAEYTRSLYDLDDQVPLCVHDWDVPAAEEMLAIHMLLRLPGWELYLRKLEGEDGVELHADAQRHHDQVMGALALGQPINLGVWTDDGRPVDDVARANAYQRAQERQRLIADAFDRPLH